MADGVWALGAMSGTSMDGVDAAMVLTDGETIAEFGPCGYEPYSEEERSVIRAAQGRWPGEPEVAEAALVVEAAHLRLLSRFKGVEVVGFHGQTLAHEPGGRGTHQAGDGARLARALGVPVVWDFRSADVGLGGQGAPLAPFFHFALARRIGAAAPTGYLNLGGVGNLTLVDPTAEAPDQPGALVAFDTGPANAPMDDLIRARTGAAQDAGGAQALRGCVDDAVVARAMERSYFSKIPPKSLDRGAFGDLAAAVAHLGLEDALATLTAISAEAVARGLDHLESRPSRVLVSGGGRHNMALMAALEARLGVHVVPVEEVGLDGDMIEAQAFGYLAVRVLRKLATSAPGTTGVAAPVGGGVVSRP